MTGVAIDDIVRFLYDSTDAPILNLCTLSLHDALPICHASSVAASTRVALSTEITRGSLTGGIGGIPAVAQRASQTSIPSPPRSEEHTSELSHTVISYAVFCLKKKITRATAQMRKRLIE